MAFSKKEALTLFQKAIQADRLGHAYLLYGSSKEEIILLSEEIASLILGCGLPSIHEHPDFHQVAPESKTRKILTEQMRHLEKALHLKPETSLYKVAVIHDADRMVPGAANAFLKTLEEPPDQTVLFLTTLLPEAILPTIRSRCLVMTLHKRAQQHQNEQKAPSSSNCDKESQESSVSKEKIETLMKSFFYEGAPHDATAAFAFTRAFQELLLGARKEAIQTADEEFQIEKKQYAKTTDGSWADIREEHFKAMGEATALEARSCMLDGVANYFATCLRNLYQQEPAKNHLYPFQGLDNRQAGPSLELHQRSEEGNLPIEKLASREQLTNNVNQYDDQKIASLLRVMEIVDSLRSTLENGVQEALALEAGFLELIMNLQR